MNIVSSIIILLTAYVAVFLEARLGGVRDWLGAQIDLLPTLVVYASLTKGVATLALLAVLGGLWFDSLSANPTGVTVLPLFLIGLAIFRTRHLILREQTYAQFFLGMSACAAAPLGTLILLLLLGETPIIGPGSLWQWLVMSVGGGALCPVVFRVFDRVHRAFDYQPLAETTFRPDREIKRGRS
jgi:rod shape-determining protein MreD